MKAAIFFMSLRSPSAEKSERPSTTALDSEVKTPPFCSTDTTHSLRLPGRPNGCMNYSEPQKKKGCNLLRLQLPYPHPFSAFCAGSSDEAFSSACRDMSRYRIMICRNTIWPAYNWIAWIISSISCPAIESCPTHTGTLASRATPAGKPVFSASGNGPPDQSITSRSFSPRPGLFPVFRNRSPLARNSRKSSLVAKYPPSSKSSILTDSRYSDIIYKKFYIRHAKLLPIL